MTVDPASLPRDLWEFSMLCLQSCRDLGRDAVAHLGVVVGALTRRGHRSRLALRTWATTPRYEDYWVS